MGVLSSIGRQAYTAAGWLTQPLLPDDVLGTLNPMWSASEPHAKVVGLRRETADTTTLLLRPGRARTRHVPGQFVGLGVRLDGVWHWRTYSATSRPADDLLAVTVTAVPGGAVSGALAHRTPVGTLVRLGPPAGEFVLPSPVPEKLLFVTAGSGITPVMGMLRELAVTRPEALDGAVLVHCDRTPRDVVFGLELRALAASTGLRLVERHTALEGRLTADTLGDCVPDWAARQTWLCGPAGMIDDLTAHWARSGDPDTLHVERFVPPAFAGDSAGGTVSFTTSGIAAEVAPGTPLMVAGEAAGAVLPSGCRMGICHTCVGRLRSGAVRDLNTGELHDTPGDHVRTCVSGAAGDVEIEL
ncbi:ferredoxin reductase [Pseudonocardia sp. KRD-184]|uniref:Ferredoxin reductase n=1 Tax=Pseudonocardia oceani TaxID=2792013 RepID=A0ABS6U5L9_9PSEU|nr:ferredoxin reductase [Pseudonocardia oceani]MBW0090214.1 ferredoxin reductase [Pseudonocardia oceani]MBW0095692.1 ferredoxin reductase [Pseudonocardia oceani]MBW0108351.1 ferredoxin reductase [Pseudonocardia oceani]MBW0122564.1 ferredoxin reductase [Pseudonocardia oceani]MBW0127530.1 ferredoxin reductase [Pseudonocardia oceani]